MIINHLFNTWQWLLLCICPNKLMLWRKAKRIYGRSNYFTKGMNPYMESHALKIRFCFVNEIHASLLVDCLIEIVPKVRERENLHLIFFFLLKEWWCYLLLHTFNEFVIKLTTINPNFGLSNYLKFSFFPICICSKGKIYRR